MESRNAQPKLMREILDKIKQNIREGKLTVGDRLPSERQMAEEFGVSRTTIREALKALETMGLIQCVQGGGNYISANFDHSMTEPLTILFMLQGGSIAHLHQVRRALEMQAAAVVPELAADADLERLRELCRHIEEEPLEESRAMLDKQLHYEIAALSGNPLINVILNAASDLIESYIADVRISMLAEDPLLSTINLQHRAIVEAFARRDREQAIQAMGQHMDFLERHIAAKMSKKK